MKDFYCMLRPGTRPKTVEIIFRAELTEGMFRKGWPSRKKILLAFIAQADAQLKASKRGKRK